MRRLGVAHALLYFFDFVFDMTVGYQDVRPAVVVVIEEEAAKAKGDESSPAYFRARRFVHKETVAFVVVEREHLVSEIRDDDAGTPGAVVISRVYAHSGASNAIFA